MRTNETIAASWALRGDLARASSFSTGIDSNERYVMADINKIGFKESVSARVLRVVPLDAPDEVLEETLDLLYSDIRSAVGDAPNIGVRWED